MEPMIGIIGDRKPGNPTHLATENAFRHVAKPLAFEWIPTGQIAVEQEPLLERFSGFSYRAGKPLPQHGRCSHGDSLRPRTESSFAGNLWRVPAHRAGVRPQCPGDQGGGPCRNEP